MTASQPGSVVDPPRPEGSPSSDVALSVSRIHKRYGGVVALRDVSLDFPTGTLTAIVGDNGAGKSTLLKVISGAEQPDAGQVVLHGEIRRFRSPLDARTAGIETVYQDLALADNLDAAQNLFMGRELKVGWGPLTFLRRRAMRRDTEQIIRRLNIKIPSVRIPVQHFSGGQRQGVAIARAMNWGNEVIIMDEPTAALGIAETARVEDLITTLRERNLTIVVVSHNLDQVFRLADRIAVMRRGQLIELLDAHSTDAQKLVSLITGLAASHDAADGHEGA
ncbi:ATP-binding cassette domain-containing protein [Candidatus Poriferisocius sp.]|uniref:ATP-binding cassette domain-containing protein n=1 Tax=Candidatus Poriferisocius sp. TaxID=3101276 RepID=UPI003B5A24CD